MSGEKDSGQTETVGTPRTSTWKGATPPSTVSNGTAVPATRALRPGAVAPISQSVPIGPPAVQAVLAEAPSGPVLTADAPAPDRDLYAAGTRLGGFEILRLMGRGGMGAVYEAVDTQLSRTVALKTLTAGMANREAAVARFKLEAQAAAQLLHPNVVAVHAFGVDRGVAYMAMEYLRGETLAAAIARAPLTVERTADIMLSVCAGVHAAHRAGIVHRDLKPSNIFLAQDWFGERPKVLDFGISKLTGETSELTETGDIVGTSQYLSPEQAAGRRDLDARSDQYSLGVVLYECVTQVTPNAGENLYALIRNIVEGRHRPVRDLRPELVAGFEAIIEKAMAVSPEDRFASVREMGAAFLPLASEPSKRQWSDHYLAAGEVELASRLPSAPWTVAGGLDKTDADPQAVCTVDRPEPRPAEWQLRPTRSAVLEAPAAPVGPSAAVVPQWVPSNESASLNAVTLQQRQTLRRVLFGAGRVGGLAGAALLGGRTIVGQRGAATAVEKETPAPAASSPPVAPAVVPSPGPAAPDAGRASEAAVPAAGMPQDAAAPRARKTERPEPPKRRAADGKTKNKGKLRYTPDGLPIL